jgi:Outer membrane protease
MLQKSMFSQLQSFIFLTLALACTSLQAASTIASQPNFIGSKNPNDSDPFAFDFSCYGGLVNGLTKEIVFSETDQGKLYKASQLDWEIRELWVVGVRAAVHVSDQKFHFIVDGWGKATSRESVMVDQDWDEKISLKTPMNISWSPSYLKSAYKIMGEIAYDFYQTDFALAQLQTTLLAGYQYFQLAWKDYGGRYVYNYGAYRGRFSDQVGISYSQEYSIPYFGLEFNGTWKKVIQWTCYGKVSNSTFVHQNDIHHLREITFDEEIPYGVYWMAGTSLSLSFLKYFHCNIKYGYEQINEAIGTMTIYEKNEPPQKFLGSGVYHRHQTLSLGINSTF